MVSCKFREAESNHSILDCSLPLKDSNMAPTQGDGAAGLYIATNTSCVLVEWPHAQRVLSGSDLQPLLSLLVLHTVLLFNLCAPMFLCITAELG